MVSRNGSAPIASGNCGTCSGARKPGPESSPSIVKLPPRRRAASVDERSEAPLRMVTRTPDVVFLGTVTMVGSTAAVRPVRWSSSSPSFLSEDCADALRGSRAIAAKKRQRTVAERPERGANESPSYLVLDERRQTSSSGINVNGKSAVGNNRAVQNDFAGRVAIVTGAARGLGRAAAERLHERGASVAVNVRDAPRAQALAESLGDRALPVPGDITADGAPEDITARTLERFGRIDILV